MATLIACHEVEDGDHWVSAWHGGAGSRQEMFGRIGVTARIFRDPEHPDLTGLIFEVPDMDRFQAFMATDEVAQAMREDGLRVETVRVLSEITPWRVERATGAYAGYTGGGAVSGEADFTLEQPRGMLLYAGQLRP